MAKKDPEQKKPMSATSAETKAVRLELSPEAHKKLRVQAALQNLSMAALVRSIVESYLDEVPK